MKTVIKLLFAFFSSIFLMTCSLNWTAYPDPYPRYQGCKPSAMETTQMVFIPGYGQAAAIVEDCQYFRREKISIAFRAFESEWEKQFGRSAIVSQNLREMVVMFSFEKRMSMGYSITGELFENAILLGSTTSKNTIWVRVSPGANRVCDTSLVHELVHASIWSINREHGDPDHAGNKFYGWNTRHNILIQNVNEYLCEIGI